MNLNFYNNPEYELNRSLITEMISMYGIQVKFVKVKKINEDNLFKDGICEKLQSIPYGDVLKIEVWTKWQSRLLIGDNKKLFLNGNG